MSRIKMKKLILIFMWLFLVVPAYGRTPIVRLETNFGDIVIELYEDDAPITVENFLMYVKSDFYNGLIFHRITKEGIFVVQGGSVDADLNSQDPCDPIINESYNGLSNLRGTVAMARQTGADTATSGFYINWQDNNSLDRPDVPENPNDVGYCVFGQVISDMNVVDRIAQLPTEDELPKPSGPAIIYRAEILGDFDEDSDVDLRDYGIFTNQWLDSGNSAPIKVTASEGGAAERFGFAVAVDANFAIVGAPGNSSLEGAAYIFRYSDGNWIQQAKLTASDGEAGDYFGGSVSISANHAIIGAPGDDDYTGSAYIFVYSDGSWTQQEKLLAYDPEAGDMFGQSVSISGDLAVVGAALYDISSIDAGAVFVYYRNEGGTNNWGLHAGLSPDDTAANDNFGYSVSINGEYVVAGAIGDNPDGDFPNWIGSAYLSRYDGDDGTWIQDAKLTADDGAELDKFGWSVSTDGRYAVVGAPLNDDNGDSSGSVYVFDILEPQETDPNIWIQNTKLTASDAAAGDSFGYSVAISGGRLLVGAYGDDDNGSNSGSVYIFEPDEINPNNWDQKTKLTAPDAAADDRFGSSVAVGIGRRAVIGAYGNDDSGSNSGSAYILKLCPDADIDDDCAVTFYDLTALIENWLLY